MKGEKIEVDICMCMYLRSTGPSASASSPNKDGLV